MLLGAMKVILSGSVTPKHNIRFTFQRAEENPGTSVPTISGTVVHAKDVTVTYNSTKGGEQLVKEGLLDNIQEVYALHIWSVSEAGDWNIESDLKFTQS